MKDRDDEELTAAISAKNAKLAAAKKVVGPCCPCYVLLVCYVAVVWLLLHVIRIQGSGGIYSGHA
jgi:hypothetical protein